MKRVLVIGAGRSTSALIKYLSDHSTANNWQITVTDRDEDTVNERISGMPNTECITGDALDNDFRQKLIRDHDLVISMLPAIFHIHVVRDCVTYKKDLITPSYVSSETKEMHQQAKDAGIIVLNEIGLDPGIDHMSAMKILDHIRDEGGKIRAFKSFTGGLIAPESDNNPWHYKFTWNPRNVVLAGQGGAVKYIKNGRYKYIPYNQLFKRLDKIEIEGYGSFEGYANRDSLKYRHEYGLDNIPTIYRGTLRKAGFCKAWDALVSLGMTDDTYTLEGSEHMTYRDFTNSFLAYHPTDSVELKLRYVLRLDPQDHVFDKLEWLGLFEKKQIGLKNASPAQILEHILKEKWTMADGDKDMIVMWHNIQYELGDEEHEIISHLVCIGEDDVYTGMAKTVGYPLGISAKLILQDKLKLKGVQLPTHREIYHPILEELESLGITFEEKSTILSP